MIWILLLLLMVGFEITAAEKETDTSTASPHTELVKAYVQNFNVAQFLADSEQQKLALENLHALRKLLPYERRDQLWRPLGNMRGGNKGREDWDSIIKTHEDLMEFSWSITDCTKCHGKTLDEQIRCADRVGFIVNPQLRKLLSEDKSLSKLSVPLLAIIGDYAEED
jgi:hypothetical protein